MKERAKVTGVTMPIMAAFARQTLNKPVPIKETENHNLEAAEEGLQVWEKQNTVWDNIMAGILSFNKPNCQLCKKGQLIFAGNAREAHWNPG